MLIGLNVNIWTEKIQLVLGWTLPVFHCSQISDRWWHRLASTGCHEALNQEPGKRVTVRAGYGGDLLAANRHAKSKVGSGEEQQAVTHPISGPEWTWRSNDLLFCMLFTITSSVLGLRGGLSALFNTTPIHNDNFFSRNLLWLLAVSAVWWWDTLSTLQPESQCSGALKVIWSYPLWSPAQSHYVNTLDFRESLQGAFPTALVFWYLCCELGWPGLELKGYSISLDPAVDLAKSSNEWVMAAQSYVVTLTLGSALVFSF